MYFSGQALAVAAVRCVVGFLDSLKPLDAKTYRPCCFVVVAVVVAVNCAVVLLVLV